MGIMTKREWQRSDVENLIKSYQTYEMLWDVKSDGYKNKALKRAAIQELSKQFGRSTDEITRKLHNLRSQFNSELKKLRTHTGTSSGGTTTGTSGGSGRRSRGNAVAVDNGFISKWPFFTQLHFLRNVSKIDMSLDVETMKAEAEEFQNPTTYGSDAETDNVDQIEQLYINSQSEEEQYARQLPAPQKVPNIVYNPSKKRKSDELDTDQMVLIPEKPMFSSRMSYVQPPPAPGDQFDIFGLYVASELKNLSSQYLRKKLKRKIQEVVLEICEEDERLASPLYPINSIHLN